MRHASAYELTARLLRLHNGGARHRIFAANGFDDALCTASANGYTDLLAVLPGCFISDLSAMIAFIGDGAASERHVYADGGDSPILAYVNLVRWRRQGEPPFGSLTEEPFPSSVTDGLLYADPDDPCAYYLALTQLQEMALAWRDQVWTVNYEELSCSVQPPGPVRLFIGVASGLKPNALLDASGWTPRTQVLYVDSSSATLAFRRWLVEEWNGDDYRSAIERWRRLQGRTTLVSEPVLERIQAMEAHFGGRRALRKHWGHYRRLKHSYWNTSLLGDQETVLAALRQSAGPRLVWCSNVFHSLYTHVFQDEMQSEALFDHWMNELAMIPGTFVVGTDAYGGDITQLIRA